MKRKIIAILVMTLLIATALPAIGTMNEIKDENISSTCLSGGELGCVYSRSELKNMGDFSSIYATDSVKKENICSMQSSGDEWNKTYGGDEADKLRYVSETTDGYIACGSTEINNNFCPYILKVDSAGNEEWNWTITEFYYNDTYFNITYCYLDGIKQTDDGGYVACFMFIFDNNQMEHALGGLVKLNSNGGEEWMQLYGDEFEWTILPERNMEVDDGFIGVGAHNPSAQVYPVDRAACLFKTNNIGELQWHQEYDYGPIFDWARSFCSTDDGYLIVGDVGIIAGVESHAWIIKTDTQGIEEWNKTYSDGGIFIEILPTTGGYMLAGSTQTQGAGWMDGWLAKIDNDGNMIWNRTFGESGYDECTGFDTIDNDYFIATIIIGWGLSTDSWIIKIDTDGNIIWKEIYGGSGSQFIIGICSTNDGGCIGCGTLGQWDTVTSDALLVKYSAFENQRPNKPDKPSGDTEGKPGTEYTYSTSCTDPDGDDVLFKWDWGDGNFSEWLDTTEASYTWEEKGIYNVKVMAKDEHGGESDWSDPLVVTMPRSKAIQTSPFLNFLQAHPNLFKLMQMLLQRLGLQ